MAKHHPDLIFCRKQAGVGDGKCVICDSYVRPCTLVRICDECNYGSYQGRCVICGGPGVSDAYYCKECTIQEKDSSNTSPTIPIYEPVLSLNRRESVTKVRAGPQVRLASPLGAVGLNTLLTLPEPALLMRLGCCYEESRSGAFPSGAGAACPEEHEDCSRVVAVAHGQRYSLALEPKFRG
ncbi:PHD finger-like domain-containing protein 5A [Cricetulus griseus]|uniref:PHD finger-like domain-containing protein 5A n=1 Tax=Cricetulus griseus TaxID=10029 RepID=G3II46_CRIGR|nr:PHD finger-like domain-containing protein 5A [Cricetulus griseus]